MKKFFTVIAVLSVLVSLMLFEYRFIMYNIHPYLGPNGAVYLEFLGNYDTYQAEVYREKCEVEE